MAKIFAEVAGRRPVWDAGLEGWNVEVSQVVQEWLAQGEAKGRIRGLVEGQQAALMRVLQRRFGGAVPAEVSALIAAQGDVAILGRWIDLALAASTLDDFRAGLAAL